MIEIFGGGRNSCRSFKSLKRALNDVKRLQIENELLLAQKKTLENENARLKADKEEMARRDLQIAEEADKLNQKYEVECVKFKNLMLNVEKARKEIEELMPNNPYYRHYFGERIAITNVLEVFDKYLAESEE